MRVNSALIKSLGSQWPNSLESDDSEDDDALHFRMMGGL